MPGPFTITAATSSLNLDAQRHAEASFTISNDSGRFIRGRALLVPQDPAAAAWFTLGGEAEHDYPVAGIQQYTVQVAVPPDAAPGTYSFRLDAVGTGNPDEEFTRGPEVAFAVLPPPPPPPPRKPFPIWIPIVAGVVILLVIIGIIAVVLLNRGGADFAGDWTTDFGVGPTCAMHLNRNGSNITGTYCNGTISGTVSNANGTTVLNGNWQAFGNTGTLRFYIADSTENQFTGNWNITNPWCGARSGQPQPTPCFRP